MARPGVALILVGTVLVVFSLQGHLPFIGGPIALDSPETFWAVALIGLACVGFGVHDLTRPGEKTPETRVGPQDKKTGNTETHSTNQQERKLREPVKRAIAQLGTLTGFNRERALQSLANTLPNDLSGYEVTRLLDDLWGFTRRDAIILIAGKVSRSLSGEEFSSILGSLDGSAREEAIKALNR